MRTAFLIIIVGIFTFMIYLFFHLGFHKPVGIGFSEEGPFQMIYKEHSGPYHKIGDKIREVEDWAKQNNVPCPEAFGEYLDDPSVVEHDRLRSHGGCIVTATPSSMPADIKTQMREKRSYIKATFSGSPLIGPMKVYPKMLSYSEAHKRPLDGAIIEIYRPISEKEMLTTYYFPVK